ncbi:MAG: hypothetical protein AVDCRST_MAG83-3754 [uncultured Arthrobacter sp.]|uniref:Uncharacterized protein n=1 Tax=uncultured Arthrobacter sp. TaxID=114050 RepID=A0A6J4JJW9_9MICC|nr:MAG: hypothetical protein AVDCRST_MAG83-3754 [uncultured Arthrobacter sp.]
MAEMAATSPQLEAGPPVRVGSNGNGRIGRNSLLAALARSTEKPTRYVAQRL